LREKSGVQVRFLLGPAGSGKTFRCLAEIRAALRAGADGPPLILLAPKQATFQLERQLLDAEWWGGCPPEPENLGVRQPVGAFESGDTSPQSQSGSSRQLSGYTRLHIFSFERLAQFVFERLKVAPPQVLTEEGRVMVLRALLMRH